jgi:hypothetical protein
VRNLLISTAEAEWHGHGDGILSRKRNRSFLKDRKMLSRVVDTMKIVQLNPRSGSEIGAFAAFDLNRPEFDQFFERMSRALLHEMNDTGFVDCSVRWNPLSDFGFKAAFMQRATVVREVSQEFGFAAHQGEHESVWFFLMTFFGKGFLVRMAVNIVLPSHT